MSHLVNCEIPSSMPLSILFLILLFLVAFLYSSVGHGGASGYLALMALFSVSQDVSRPTALMLNVVVASVAFWKFYQASHFKFDLFWPFALGSIPASYLGSKIPLTDGNYKKLLAICLFIAILRILFQPHQQFKIKQYQLQISVLLGVGIGLLSGMLSIGGGIILSPILLLFGLGNQKETAAVSAAFILVNSVAALVGLFQKGIVLENTHFIWLGIALVGGFLGSSLGSQRFNTQTLRYALALGLFIASTKLLLT